MSELTPAQRRWTSGPFTVEPVGDNPYLCGFRTWLTDKPEKVWEFADGRELGDFFQQACSSSSATGEQR